jgi:Heparinase II/III-like protein/Heparinase II/III N-terminus
LCALEPINRILRAKWPSELDALLDKSVQDLRAGRITLLSQTWPKADLADAAGSKIWHLDPVTGNSWPGSERYCFDIDYRHNHSLGDVKFVWELNRLQFLQPAALVAGKHGDEALAGFVIEALRQWMDANPPFRGVNWSSGIELAMRLVSLAVVVSSLDHSMIDTRTRSLLRSFVAAHAYWLARYPSLFSSANNHRVAEGLGLVVAGLLVPDLPHADVYLAEGTRIIDEAPLSQFLPDGIGAEQSPTYTAFTLEMFATARILLADRAGDWSPDSTKRLARAVRCLHLLLDREGNCPRIGDDDEGRVLAVAPIREERYVASVTATLAAHLGIPDLSPETCDRHWRDLLFRTSGTGAPAPDGMTCLREGGYTIVRDRISGRDMLLAFDHGPLGFLAIAAHGHADALAIWLHLDGMPVFVDAGTYLYHAGGAWREHFRSTSAHNTVTIDGSSQSITAGSFNWRSKARAWLHESQTGSDWCVIARHDGYRTRFGVEHERSIARAERGFTVVDRLSGTLGGAPSVNASFLLNPLLSAVIDGGRVVIRHGSVNVASVQAAKGGHLSLSSDGNAAVPKPFYSPRFGAKVPAVSIVVSPGSPLDPIVTSIEIMSQ